MPIQQQQYALGGRALTRDETRSVFGQVMGLVALTVGCTALGAYIGRNLSGGTSLIIFIAAFACIFGLQSAARRGHEQLAVGLLFALGLLLGLAVGPALAVYAQANPAALWQARRARPGRSSPRWAPMATRPGAICRRGHEACSSPCWR